ncbi:MAG: LytR C-terminal domain-containing protein [Patescibacteria group bacterium]
MSISIMFLIAVGVLFFFSIQFISSNINKVFTIEDDSGTSALNITQYSLVAKKLGIPPDASKQPEPIEAVAPTSVGEINFAATISIMNGTSKTGIAGTLAKKLQAAGFTTVTTSNAKNKRTSTSILAKESAMTAAKLVLEIVSKTYPGARIATSTETTLTDIEIFIGGK